MGRASSANLGSMQILASGSAIRTTPWPRHSGFAMTRFRSRKTCSATLRHVWRTGRKATSALPWALLPRANSFQRLARYPTREASHSMSRLADHGTRTADHGLVVDAYVLDLPGRRVLSRNDVFETRDGACRLLPPLTQGLAETTQSWVRRVGPWAERSARLLLADQTPSKGAAMPTPLTGANRRAGRGLPATPAMLTAPKPTASCRDCGLILEDRERLYCDDCLPHRREETVALFAIAGPAALARRRTEGNDPAHGGEAGRAKGQRNAAHAAANAAWEATHGTDWDPEEFRREILPKLQTVPLSLIMEATGLSGRYSSLVRRGEEVPHPRHWVALSGLGGVDSSYGREVGSADDYRRRGEFRGGYLALGRLPPVGHGC